MTGTEGNESIIAREPILHDGTIRRVPYLSGNALRSCCIRNPGMRWLIDQYGLAGKLPLPQLNFLLHGGALTESTGRENVARIAEMHDAWPLLRVLGGSLPDQILSGSLIAGRGVLVCEENRPTLKALVPDQFELPTTLLPGETFVRPYQYMTYDANDRDAELVAPASGDKTRGAEDVRMIYAGQSVAAGALFVHDFVIRWARPEDVGALLWSLQLWQANGSTIGGMAAKGHGRLDTAICVTGIEPDQEQLVEAYKSAALKRKDRAVTWLAAAFKEKEKKEKKPGRQKKEAAEPVE
jgi:hypothetical protein